MDATPTPPRPQRPSGERAFATGYRAHTGDMMVYGGGVLTLIGVLATVVNGNPLALGASFVGSLSALYFWPTLDTRRAQLGASRQGVFVARIGIIPWSAVHELRVERRALRTMRLATLHITTDRPPLEAVSAADVVPLSERFTARNARVSGRTIKVQLHTLAMPIDAIEQRLRRLRAQASP